jgi:hypothetical protein
MCAAGPGSLLIDPRDAVDLDLPSRPKHGLHGGSRRKVIFEELPVDVVHGLKIIDVSKEHRDFHYVFDAAVRRFQDVLNIRQFQAGFRFDIAQFHLLGFGINRPLARDENKAPGNNRL